MDEHRWPHLMGVKAQRLGFQAKCYRAYVVVYRSTVPGDGKTHFSYKGELVGNKEVWTCNVTGKNVPSPFEVRP